MQDTSGYRWEIANVSLFLRLPLSFASAYSLNVHLTLLQGPEPMQHWIMGHALSAKKNNPCWGKSISQTLSRKQRELCEILNNNHKLDTDYPVIRADTMALVAFYAHILHDL